jgi:hypothetical protein
MFVWGGSRGSTLLKDGGRLWIDIDHDGLLGGCDNCRLDFNPEQKDTDADGEGDLCDLDDGILLLRDMSKTSVAWQDEAVFEKFNLYRGSLVRLRTTGQYTQDPAIEPEAARYCQLVLNQQQDSRIPPIGEADFYLVSGVHAGVEGSLGTRSNGTERPNDHPCP